MKVIVLDGATKLRSTAGGHSRFKASRDAIIAAAGLRRARAGERCADREAMLKAFGASSQPMMIGRAGDGLLLRVNRASENFFGLAGDELRGLKAFDARLFEEASDCRRVSRLWASPGGIWNTDVRLRARGGQAREAALYATPLLLDSDACLLLRIVDTTKAHRLEESLRRVTSRLLQIQDEERRRMARDLHDGIAQDLFAVSLDLAHLEKVVSDAAASAQARECLAMIRTILEQVRTSSWLLHPPSPDQSGLVQAFRCYIQGFSARSGIEVDFHTRGAIDRLPAEIETALFLIAREGLSNIQRHSGSERARVELVREGRSLSLSIEDFGRGMTAERGIGQAPGVGLSGMSHRVRELGGTIEITSTPGSTVIRAIVPIEENIAA